MKKILFCLGIVVLASGCISNGSDQVKNNDTENVDSGKIDNKSTYNIVFEGEDFEPSSITIDKGETVIWEDKSDRTMWIASNVHPSHRRYSGTSLSQHCGNGQNNKAFDQCSTGDKFSFTFNKKGEWGYHNHKPFVEGGIITVK